MKKHWTPRYIYNRTKNYFFEKNNQHLPWLTPDSIYLLDNLIKKTDTGIEFGSGRSTIWFASKCKFITSVEDHKGWYDKIKERLNSRDINNVDYLYKESLVEPVTESPYYKVITSIKDNTLDFALIDGKHRGHLSLEAIHKLKVGGLLIVDDIERYVPYKTFAPHSIYGKPEKFLKEWIQFVDEIQPWRKIMTSNGVTDTIIYIKK